MTTARRVTVPLGERAYDVVVGDGVVDRLPGLLPSTARRAAVVTQSGIPITDTVVEQLTAAGLAVVRIDIDHGEEAKSLTTIEHVTTAFAAHGLTRHDVVVGVGGGMVTDIAGFAAAVWHRGVPVVHVATSLLAMIDAAIGGKTGVNLAVGKNLVGAFWQPDGVVVDVAALATLPARERRSGDGEMAKYHFLTGEDLTTLDLVERIARCVELKAEVVAADEREGGRRALLNYGHTLAHAIEIATDHAVTHGEAVGIGLVFAAELAARTGRIDAERVADHRAVVGDVYGLATELPAGVGTERLLELIGHDKKNLTDGLTFVLDGPAGIEVVSGIEPATVAAALDDYGARR